MGCYLDTSDRASTSHLPNLPINQCAFISPRRVRSIARKCKTYTFSLGPTANVLSQVGFASYSVCDRQPFAEENFASDHPLCMRRKEREWVWLRVLSDDLKS